VNQRIRIKLKSYDHNLVDKSAEKNREDRKINRCCGKRADPFTIEQEDLHRFTFAFRKQKSERTV